VSLTNLIRAGSSKEVAFAKIAYGICDCNKNATSARRFEQLCYSQIFLS
jgi:hypothetical protein